MTIKKYGTGGKPEVVEDDEREPEQADEEATDDDERDDGEQPVASES